MKKVISIMMIVMLMVTLIVAGNSLWKKNAKTMSNLKAENNLQKKGVLLITPSDANFEAELATYLKGNQEIVKPFIDAAKPFVVFVKNTSGKDIVGVSLRWEITKSDGSIQVSPQDESTPYLLMGGKTHAPAEQGGFNFSLLPSNSAIFFSLNPLAQSTVRTESKRAANNRPSFLTNEIRNQLEEKLAKGQINSQRLSNESQNIAVSIDGIFFNDGTFVGEDKNNFYATTEALIRAQRDLTKEIRAAGKAKKSTSEVFKRLESLASKKPEYPDKFDSKAEEAEYFYKIQLFNFASQTLRRSLKLSKEDLIGEITSNDLGKWSSLRKEDL
jgi:hypothetical protein